MPTRRQLSRTAVVALGAVLWWASSPADLSVQAWRLFTIFPAAIFSVVINAPPILTASVLAVALAVLSGLLPPLFVSQTAHLLALLGIFLDVGIKLGVNPALLAFQLLFATDYFSVRHLRDRPPICSLPEAVTSYKVIRTGSVR